MPYEHRANDRYQLTGLNSASTEAEVAAKGQHNNGVTVPLSAPAASPGTTPQSAITSGDAFDAAEFDALSLPEKLHRATHAALTWKMALIATTDPATASDARVKAALAAAQSIVLSKIRVDEMQFRPQPPSRMAEHLARWQKLKAEDDAKRERAEKESEKL